MGLSFYDSEHFKVISAVGTNMADIAKSVSGAGMIGALDVAVLGGVAALAAYWFFFRKKDDDVPDVKTLAVNTSSANKNENYDPSFINKMKRTGKNVVVFYGSQTGTAEEFSSRLAKDCARYGLKGMVADPEECEMDDLVRLSEVDKSMVIFCLATYGEGDPTDNAQEFFDWLQDGSADLNGVNYAVFGLGNKTYEHYNKMGIYVDQRMEELGASRVCELGMGDDDANIEEDFLNWREKFWPSVCEYFSLEATGEDINIREYEMKMVESVAPEKMYYGEPARLQSFKKQRPPFDSKNPFLAPISVNRELHNGGDRSCMHIEFDITGSKLRYEAGDHVAVYPTNDPELVELIGKRLSIDMDQIFTMNNLEEDANKKHPFPCPTTFRTALSHYIDITHPLRTNVLKELSEYADSKDKEFLLKLASNTPEGKELYSKWMLHDRRHILAVLEALPSVNPAIDHLLELLPRLQPRYYSISSSPKMNPTSISITAVLVDYDAPAGHHMKGVATSYLALKQPAGEDSPRVPIFVRKSQFRLPFKPTVPVIMIGPGTGLAPFRGFIQDRHAIKEEGKPIGEAVLYFGCRHKAEDFIYEDELNSYLEDKTITGMHLAFSRDQEEKIYVQHLIAQNKEEIWKILEDGGHLYVCGDARHMAHDVDLAIQHIISEKGEMSEDAAHNYLKKMRSRGRYSCDVWS